MTAPSAEAPVNLREYEERASRLLPQGTFDYYAGGAADEITLRENEEAWARLRLCPRVLVDVSACDLRTTILGRPVSMPVMTGPAALNAMAHPDGELAVARAAAAADIIQVLSTGSAFSMEEVAASAPGTRWFQLYCMRDRGLTRALVERAEAAGYAALCLTVDAPFDGIRERQIRNPSAIPPAGMRQAHLGPPGEGGGLRDGLHNDATLGWAVLEYLRGVTKLPVVMKGIVSAEDARLAADLGASGLIVSNHGGRQLDTTLSTCAALPRVAEAVSGRAEVYADGGLRRGTDVLKALALGARAVLVARPYLWGLAVGGEAGVRHVLQMLRDELRVGMILAGCPRVGDVRPALIASDKP